MLTFLAALYNEDQEVDELIRSVYPFVDQLRIVDDGSTDLTVEHLRRAKEVINNPKLDRGSPFQYMTIPHTGLPETVKNIALMMVPTKSWVLMLDADERIDPKTLADIRQWVYSAEAVGKDYVYLRQIEIINGHPVREFQKAKVFRKEAIRFPLNNIHADDQFEGKGIYKAEWIVEHRKSSTKQIVRETEYLMTYKKLLDEGKIDEGRYRWLINLHHYVRPKG